MKFFTDKQYEEQTLKWFQKGEESAKYRYKKEFATDEMKVEISRPSTLSYIPFPVSHMTVEQLKHIALSYELKDEKIKAQEMDIQELKALLNETKKQIALKAIESGEKSEKIQRWIDSLFDDQTKGEK